MVPFPGRLHRSETLPRPLGWSTSMRCLTLPPYFHPGSSEVVGWAVAVRPRFEPPLFCHPASGSIFELAGCGGSHHGATTGYRLPVVWVRYSPATLLASRPHVGTCHRSRRCICNICQHIGTRKYQD